MKQRMDDFVKIMMKQDDLYQAAIALEMAAAGVTDTSLKGLISKADSISSPPTDTGLRYILDVENAVAFTYVNEVGTKWKALRAEPLANLFFYPWRASNILIRTLANYFIEMAKDTDDLLSNETFKGSPRLKALQASHIEASVKSNAWYLTDKDLADGFYTSQDIGKFKTEMNGFFTDLVNKMVEHSDLLKDKPFGPEVCKKLFYTTTPKVYADATARLYLLYKQHKDKWNTTIFLQQFGKECKIEGTAAATELAGDTGGKSYLPDEIYWKSKILDTDVTFESIIGQISPLLLNYLLRLSYALENPNAGAPLTPAALAAIATAAEKATPPAGATAAALPAAPAAPPAATGAAAPAAPPAALPATGAAAPAATGAAATAAEAAPAATEAAAPAALPATGAAAPAAGGGAAAGGAGDRRGRGGRGPTGMGK